MLKVVYCPICSLPPEYCEYGPSFEKCKPWLKDNFPELYPELFGADAAAKGIQNLNVGGPSSSADGEKAKGSSGKPKPSDPDVKLLPGGKIKKKEQAIVLVARRERSKRKFVTSVTGLDLFGVKLSDATKVFSKRFSCGASVVKSNDGTADEIDVQGDVKDDIVDVILDNFEVIPENAIYFLEDKKKVPARG